MSLDSLLCLLEAASSSPTAVHRLASLALVFDAVMKMTRTGTGQATPEMLPKLVSAANRERHDLAALELFLPHDARPGVVVRWGENLYRMLPGSMDYPLGVVDTLRLLAEVIDPVLMEHMRFGLADVVELILRRADHVASVMGPTWSGRQERSEAPPRISSHEFAAAETLMDISHQVAPCQNPVRAQRALEFFSVRPKRLRLNSSGLEARETPPVVARLSQNLA